MASRFVPPIETGFPLEIPSGVTVQTEQITQIARHHSRLPEITEAARLLT